MKVNDLIKLLRPHQYLKNGFVLVGVLFSQQWNTDTLIYAGMAFTAFCLIASAVYIMNDWLDRDADRQHPVKRNRPLASGTVSATTALVLFALLVVSAATLAAVISTTALLFTGLYLLLNIGYSLKWKQIVILDVFIISTGFMLRILTGTLGIGIAPSSWLLLCGLMITLFLGFAKRHSELQLLGEQEGTRQVLGNYSLPMLEQYISITVAGTLLSYCLYTLAPETVELHGTRQLIYTIPFVIYGLFRYLYLLHMKGKGTDTSKDILTDSHLLVTGLCWAVTAYWALQ